jgi:hypothetical protein
MICLTPIESRQAESLQVESQLVAVTGASVFEQENIVTATRAKINFFICYK